MTHDQKRVPEGVLVSGQHVLAVDLCCGAVRGLQPLHDGFVMAFSEKRYYPTMGEPELPVEHELIEQCEYAGNGYVSVWLNGEWLERDVPKNWVPTHRMGPVARYEPAKPETKPEAELSVDGSNVRITLSRADAEKFRDHLGRLSGFGPDSLYEIYKALHGAL